MVIHVRGKVPSQTVVLRSQTLSLAALEMSFYYFVVTLVVLHLHAVFLVVRHVQLAVEDAKRVRLVRKRSSHPVVGEHSERPLLFVVRAFLQIFKLAWIVTHPRHCLAALHLNLLRLQKNPLRQHTVERLRLLCVKLINVLGHDEFGNVLCAAIQNLIDRGRLIA